MMALKAVLEVHASLEFGCQRSRGSCLYAKTSKQNPTTTKHLFLSSEAEFLWVSLFSVFIANSKKKKKEVQMSPT